MQLGKAPRPLKTDGKAREGASRNEARALFPRGSVRTSAMFLVLPSTRKLVIRAKRPSHIARHVGITDMHAIALDERNVYRIGRKDTFVAVC